MSTAPLLLAAALGRRNDAVRHLADAAAIHERLSAWPWLAWTRCELAAVFTDRDAPGDRARVIVLLDAVRRAAAEFDLPGLARTAARIGLPQLNTFRRDGDGWLISYAGQQVRLRHVKGLGDIAVLLASPARPVPATALTGEGATRGTDYGGDPVLDRTAVRQQYRTRLVALDIDEAVTGNDVRRAETLMTERDFLTREMSAAVGLVVHGWDATQGLQVR